MRCCCCCNIRRLLLGEQCLQHAPLPLAGPLQCRHQKFQRIGRQLLLWRVQQAAQLLQSTAFCMVPGLPAFQLALLAAIVHCTAGAAALERRFRLARAAHGTAWLRWACCCTAAASLKARRRLFSLVSPLLHMLLLLLLLLLRCCRGPAATQHEARRPAVAQLQRPAVADIFVLHALQAVDRRQKVGRLL